MKSYRLLAVTLLLSLLLHIIIIFFIKFVPEEKQERDKGEPIEIEVIPKEKGVNNEVISQDDNQETTLDHDRYGGRSRGEVTQEDWQSNNFDDNLAYNEEVIPEILQEENKLNLYDNQDIISRIANAKRKTPKGEDSASYNVFEERYESYFAKFRRRVYQLWEYPLASLHRGETGVVKMSFSILKDGSIINIRMLESSGYSNLDREVMRVLKNMGKIPLPESYELNQLNIEEAYFIYSIGGGYGRFLR